MPTTTSSTITRTSRKLGNPTHPWVLSGRDRGETDIACETLESAIRAAKDRGIEAVAIRGGGSYNKGLCAKHGVTLIQD